jgi:hypothetical protein
MCLCGLKALNRCYVDYLVLFEHAINNENSLMLLRADSDEEE